MKFEIVFRSFHSLMNSIWKFGSSMLLIQVFPQLFTCNQDIIIILTYISKTASIEALKIKGVILKKEVARVEGNLLVAFRVTLGNVQYIFIKIEITRFT